MDTKKYDLNYIVILGSALAAILLLKLPQPWLSATEIPCLLILGVAIKKACTVHAATLEKEKGFSIPYKATETIKSGSAEGVALWFIALFTGICAKEFIAFFIQNEPFLELFVFFITIVSSRVIIKSLAPPS